MTKPATQLSIRLQRGRDGPDVLTCVRADGTRTWQRLQRGIPVHDLTHYAVEKALGLREGFFGLIARGWDITAFANPENRDKLSPEAGWEEFVVNLLLTEMSDGAELDADEFNATLSAMIAGRLDVAPRAFTAAELASMRARRSELTGRWLALKPGEVLDLELDCATASAR
jgi:hypothetical protein